MDLTARQREILEFIQAFRAKEGYPPTVREIAGHFRIDYRAAIDHLRALERKGVENIEGAVPVPEEWAKGSGLFMVRVDREGMSMTPTILPQDYLLVKQADSADDGTIVLAMVDGEVTVKRVFRERDSAVLRSDNPAMPPIQVKKGSKNFRILGKVVGVAYRKL